MRKIFAVITLLFVFLFLSVPTASAKVVTMETGTYTLSADEVLDDDLFVGAETVEIYGTVNGDVYAGASTVRVTGTINGDLIAGAGSIYLSGTVKDDVYLGSGNIVITGADIGDSLLVGTGNINIDKDTAIGGSFLSGAGNVTTEAPVGRSMMIGAGNVDINSEIGGEVRVGGGQIRVGPETKIGQDFYYALGEDSELTIPDSATIAGEVKRIESNYIQEQNLEVSKDELVTSIRSIGYLIKIISFLGALVVGLLLIKLIPQTVNNVSEITTKNFWRSLGYGFLIMLLIFPLLVVISITIIGIPLAGLIFLLFLIASYLAKIYVGYAFGNWLVKRFHWKNISVYLSFTLGLLLICILKAIPLVGFFVTAVVLWNGLGSQILYYRERIASIR